MDTRLMAYMHLFLTLIFSLLFGRVGRVAQSPNTNHSLHTAHKKRQRVERHPLSISSLVSRPHPNNQERGLVTLANFPLCAESA